MAELENILVVVKSKDDGEIVLDKAHHLAKASGAALHVISVVHEDYADLSVHDEKTAAEIKDYVRRSGESLLEELIEPLLGGETPIESACIWNKYQWQGVLDVARDIGADFIVKGTDYPATELVRTPSDWNLLRHADVPVMLVKPINWQGSPVILAAIDATEESDEQLNKRVLERAADLATTLGGAMHVVDVYPSVEHWVGPITLAIDFDAVRSKLDKEITAKVGKMLEELGLEPARVHTREGHTEEEIHRTANETGTEILVMGTHRRTGADGVILGNSSEKIIHAVRCDVEVLR